MAVILLVEDDEQVRVLAESILREDGHAVICAAGMQSAKTLIDADEAIDLILTDLTLGTEPEAGLVIGQYAREKRPDIKVVYTSGQGVTEGMRRMFVDDFEFLAKPFTPAQLLIAIGRALQA